MSYITQCGSQVLALLLLLTMVTPVMAEEAIDIVFPKDSGIVDVTKPPYNAKGDGVTDDTAAINAALRDHNYGTVPVALMAATIYLPEGTYLVSDTLVPKLKISGDHPLCNVRIVGQGRDKTIIRLKDNSPGYDNPRESKPVIRTGYAATLSRPGRASASNQGNSGYSNYVEHLTVNTGKGNPGAGGIHYDVANVGQMQDVRIVSGDDSGRGSYGLGIFTTSGLGYVKRVEIVGFEHGIHVENTVNNIVFEHIKLTDQRRAAIYNEGKLISFRGLTTRGSVPLLSTQRPQAATFLLEVDAQTTSGGPAFSMRTPSFVYLRDVNLKGYTKGATVETGGSGFDIPLGMVEEWWSHGMSANANAKSLRLPIKETPEYFESDLAKWISVTQFGATPGDDSDDDAAAIQAAFNQAAKAGGKPVVYFPFGVYTIKQDVVVGDGVKKVDFMHSNINYKSEAAVKISIRQSKGQMAMLENLLREVPIEHDSDGTVVIRNHVGSHRGGFTTSQRATGDLYIDNVGPHAEIKITSKINVWMRAINRETFGFLNDGATVWFYGDNIERMIRKNGPRHLARRVNSVATINGGTTEYIAGCLDPLNHAHTIEDGPLFLTIDSTVSINAAGEVRKKGDEVGYWPFIAKTVINGKETRLLRDDGLYLDEGANAWPKRWVLPMYRVGPSNNAMTRSTEQH